jgi:hypothetical protein
MNFPDNFFSIFDFYRMNDNPKCPKCNVDLTLCNEYAPWSTAHYICPKCDGTYNLFEFCEFCGMNTLTREHHLTPKSKGGKETATACETCESFIHKTWTHNELRDTYNSVEAILESEKFQKFLKWRLKQPATALFKSNKAKSRDKNKYH